MCMLYYELYIMNYLKNIQNPRILTTLELPKITMPNTYSLMRITYLVTIETEMEANRNGVIPHF